MMVMASWSWGITVPPLSISIYRQEVRPFTDKQIAVGRVVNRKRTFVLFAAHPTMNSRIHANARREIFACCRSPLALAARFAPKDGGARAHRSMQQHQGFSLDSKAETTWAHLPLYRR